MTMSFGGKPVFPAPWLTDDDGQRLVFIRTEFGNVVAVLRAEHGVSMELARGTAEHICKTVNAHDDLVAALRWLIDPSLGYSEGIENARALLAKVDA